MLALLNSVSIREEPVHEVVQLLVLGADAVRILLVDGIKELLRELVSGSERGFAPAPAPPAIPITVAIAAAPSPAAVSAHEIAKLLGIPHLPHNSTKGATRSRGKTPVVPWATATGSLPRASTCHRDCTRSVLNTRRRKRTRQKWKRKVDNNNINIHNTESILS